MRPRINISFPSSPLINFDSIIYATNYFICPYKSHASISTVGDSIIRSRFQAPGQNKCAYIEMAWRDNLSQSEQVGKKCTLRRFAVAVSGGGECAMLLHFASPCSTAARPCMDSQSGCSYSIRKPFVSTRDSLRKIKKKNGKKWCTLVCKEGPLIPRKMWLLPMQ